MADAVRIPIDALSEPILSGGTLPEDLRAGVQEMADVIRGGANWKVRKKSLLDLVEGVDVALVETAADDAADDADGVPEVDVLHVLPAYVAAVLEDLDETEIVSAEQAACYLLSAHPEHQEAALGWIEADEKTYKAFRRLLRDDRRYAHYFGRISDEAGRGPGDDVATE